MSDNPENITLSPQHPLLEDGFGSRAMIVGSLSSINSEGEEIVTLKIKVNDFLKKTYDLKFKEDYDEQNIMKLIVKKIDMINLSPYDTTNQIWLYVKSFKHHPTELSNREANLKTLLNIKDKRCWTLEAENIKLHEENLLLRTNPAMAAAVGAELFKETGKVMADMMRPREKGE
jgi:hypothetical protein